MRLMRLLALSEVLFRVSPNGEVIILINWDFGRVESHVVLGVVWDFGGSVQRGAEALKFFQCLLSGGFDLLLGEG